jgi:hypothetical protein
METYLQYAIGGSLHDISMQDIKGAINAIQNIDDEHGAFFVGFYDEEDPTLETNNELQMARMFPRPQTGDENVPAKAADNSTNNGFIRPAFSAAGSAPAAPLPRIPFGLRGHANAGLLPYSSGSGGELLNAHR